MDEEWLTYQAVADRLGVTPEAARSRAKRLGWRRQMGNDGRTLVLAALEPQPPDDRPVTPRSPAGRKGVDPALVTALGHIKTLQADKEALTQDLAATRADLSAHIASLKTENERLTDQLAGAEARAGEEAAKTAEAIAAFQSLAEQLEALAEARRPWWRRLVG